MFSIEELIFDGASRSPDVRVQGLDMHSYYDGEHIWYPYNDWTDHSDNSILKYNPANDTLRKIQLTGDGITAGWVYACVESISDSNIIWIYAMYGNRGLWRFDKTTELSTHVDIVEFGQAGGKIVSAMVAGVETLVLSVVAQSGNPLSGLPVAYRVTDGRQTTLDVLGKGSYGLQTDGVNFFIADTFTNVITAFTLDADHAVVNPVSIGTLDAVDIAWDGTDIWTASRTTSSSAIERFTPVYTGEIVTSFLRMPNHYTGSPDTTLPASVKANAKYVAAVWESGDNDPPTLGWSILDRNTGVWYDFWNTADPADESAALYPFTDQYWNTVTVEIDAPNAIYIAGYNPASLSVPNTSMHLLKFTPHGSGLYNGTLSDGTLSSN